MQSNVYVTTCDGCGAIVETGERPFVFKDDCSEDTETRSYDLCVSCQKRYLMALLFDLNSRELDFGEDVLKKIVDSYSPPDSVNHCFGCGTTCRCGSLST